MPLVYGGFRNDILSYPIKRFSELHYLQFLAFKLHFLSLSVTFSPHCRYDGQKIFFLGVYDESIQMTVCINYVAKVLNFDFKWYFLISFLFDRET